MTTEMAAAAFPELLRVPREGQRIVDQMLTSESGQIQFAGMPLQTFGSYPLFDTLLQVRCELLQATVDTGRCLPAEFLNTTLYFSDPACSVPVFPAEPQPLDQLIRVAPTWTGRARFGRLGQRIFSLGATYSGDVYSPK